MAQYLENLPLEVIIDPQVPPGMAYIMPRQWWERRLYFDLLPEPFSPGPTSCSVIITSV
jgi:hypothetical protein